MTFQNTIRSLRSRFIGTLFRDAKAFRRCSAGGVAAIFTIVSPVMIGSMGLGGEAGYWYLTQRKVQNAADVAAHATALRMNEGDDLNSLQTLSEFVVGKADLDMTATAVNLATPPTSGAFIEDGAAIEITVTQTVPRLFTKMYSSDPIQISARAVATARSGGRACVLALSPDADSSITVTGSTMINLTLCDFVSNSNVVAYDMVGYGGFATANCVQTTGSATITANLTVTCENLRAGSRPVADPFAAVTEPSATGNCEDGDVGQNNQITQVTAAEPHVSGMDSMRFCNGLNISGTVDFDPGLYIVEGGDFRINSNATITGDGVVFYLLDGVEMRFNGTATVAFSAPISGDYNGILFFGDRDATTMSHQINGNFGSTLDGAIYTSASHLDIQGNAQTSFTSCTQIVADTMEFSGNGFLNLHCLFPPGPVADVAGTVRIVE